jgi:ribonuclease BN (tRNA processing enzyme)
MSRTTRPRVSLRILGCGDAFGTGGRYHTCFHLVTPRSRILIDCGASSLVAMHRFGVDPGAIDGVVISHLHGDHFGGLPFFLLDAAFVSRRTRQLVIAGPPGTAARLRRATDAMYPGFWSSPRRFKVRFIDLEDDRSVRIGGIVVKAFVVVHASGAPPYALRLTCEGCTIAYSGDTAWTERLVQAARGADLFICEASTFQTPIPYHLTYETVYAHRERFETERLVLTHAGPEVLARRESLRLELAEDGQVLHVRPRRHLVSRRTGSSGGD